MNTAINTPTSQYSKREKLDKLNDFRSEYMALNEGQKILYHGVLTGNNILLTGGGGVGKSHLIRFLSKHIPIMFITASTGIAGVNIDGDTIDSLMGFSPDPRQNRRPMSDELIQQLCAITTLLIDEASMIRCDKLDAIDARLREARKSDRPFGGVQMILAGDFCQLSPVVNERSDEGKTFKALYGDKLFCFESDSYRYGNFIPYVLNEYVRNGDPAQRRILRNLRMGHKVDEALAFINANAKGNVQKKSIKICKTNALVATLNEEYFNALPGKETRFNAIIEGDFDLNDMNADQSIRLKIGCRVILCVNNVDAGFRNGDLGAVKTIKKDTITVALDRGVTVEVERHTWRNKTTIATDQEKTITKEKGSAKQFPIRLGIAITAHKSQGMTLDSAVVDLSGKFNPPGLTYVVISRVTSLDRLHLSKPLRREDIAFSKKAIAFTRSVSLEALSRREQDKLNLPKLS